MAHARREAFRSGTPVHVTMRVCKDVASLRRRDRYRAIRRQMRASGHGEHFRIVHFSVQGNHLHLLVEPTDREALAHGIQGFAAWTARRLNRLAGRSGRVFEDRYHAHALRTKREVRAALAYVLSNWRRHDGATGAIDPCSSGDLFTGWAGWYGERHADGIRRPRWLDDGEDVPVAPARFWLLTTGWRDAGGPIDPLHRPGPAT